MAAPTKYYVDQTSGSDAGAGTTGSPWKTIEYALATGITTADATNGDEIWVKGGGESATQNWTIGTWLSTGYRDSGPLTIRGCTAFDTQDAGRCAVTFGSSYYVAMDHGVQFLQVDFDHATTATYLLSGGGKINCRAVSCGFTRSADNTGSWLNFSTDSSVINCRFTDCGTGQPITMTSGHFMFNVVIEQGSYTRAVSNAISSSGVCVYGNVFKMSSTTHTSAIVYGAHATIMHNSIYAHGSATGIGLRSLGSGGQVVINNLIEGYSGTGGDGIDIPASQKTVILAGNSIDDCTNSINRTSGSYSMIDTDNDEGTTGSPFHANVNTGDFTPQDVDNVKEGAWPGGVGLDY